MERISSGVGGLSSKPIVASRTLLSHGAVGFVGVNLTGWPVKFNTVLVGTETVLSRVSDSACAPPYVSLDRLKACGAFDWGSNPHGGVSPTLPRTNPSVLLIAFLARSVVEHGEWI